MAKRVDSNQREIVEALRQIGASVEPIHMVGRGVPDLLVGFRGQTFVLEVKARTGRLTADELDWHLRWRGQKAVVRSADEALKAIGAVE